MAKLNQNPETNEEILAFEQYMKSKGTKRDNVKSDDVGVTIPEDIKYIPEKKLKQSKTCQNWCKRHQLQLHLVSTQF